MKAPIGVVDGSDQHRRKSFSSSTDHAAAGPETTATAIRWALVFFLHHPEVQDKCYDEIQRVVGTERAPSMRDKPEMTYMDATIMEVLRRGNIAPNAVPHWLVLLLHLNNLQ